MEAIKVMNPQAYQWLIREPAEKWSYFHDKGRRHGNMTTNMAEIFNNVLKAARNLPITAAVQLIFYKLVHYFCERKKIVIGMRNSGTRYGPNILKILEKRRSDIGHTNVTFDYERGVYSVCTSSRNSRGGNTQVVDFSLWQCDCGKWQSDGIPCSHVFSVCAANRLDWEAYIVKYYSLESYEGTYSAQFCPLRHQDYWDSCDRLFLPDVTLLRERGRPRSTRIHNGMDQSERRALMRCSSCQGRGHDCRKCPYPIRARRL